MKDDSKPEELDPHSEAAPTSQSTLPPKSRHRQRTPPMRRGVSATSIATSSCERPLSSTITENGSKKEREEAAQAVEVDLITELLPLVDDLDRTLSVNVTDDAVKAYRERVKLIRKQLLHLLHKRGVTPIETEDQNFNQNSHQAVSHEVSEDHLAGAVISELRRGYMLGRRLLRPAVVKVAKA